MDVKTDDVVEITTDCQYEGQEGSVLSTSNAFEVVEEDIGSEVLVLLEETRVRAFNEDHLEVIEGKEVPSWG